jgi:hypothetical protein
MEAVSEYCVLKRNIRDLERNAEKIRDSLADHHKYGSLQNSYFNFVESGLSGLRKYPIVENLDEFHLLTRALQNFKSPKTLREQFSGEYKVITGRTIADNFDQVVTAAKKISEIVKPQKDFSKKETIAQIIRKIQEQEDSLYKYFSEMWDLTSNAIDSGGGIWTSIFNVHRIKLIERLNELKTIDPVLGCEDEFHYIMDELNHLQDPHPYLFGKEKVKSLVESRKSIGSLIGRVKVDYNITEDEIEEKVKIEKPIVHSQLELATVMRQLQSSAKPLLPKELFPIYRHLTELFSNIKNQSPLPTFKTTLSLLKSDFDSSEFTELASNADFLLQMLPMYNVEISSELSNGERAAMRREQERKKEDFVRLTSKYSDKVYTTIQVYIDSIVKREDLRSAIQLN